MSNNFKLKQENIILRRLVDQYRQSSGLLNYVDDSNIRGGFRVVKTIQERDSIDCCHKKKGMIVNVLSDGKWYELTSDTCSTVTWVEVEFGSTFNLLTSNTDSPDGDNGAVVISQNVQQISAFNEHLEFTDSPEADSGIPGHTVLSLSQAFFSKLANIFRPRNIGGGINVYAGGIVEQPGDIFYQQFKTFTDSQSTTVSDDLETVTIEVKEEWLEEQMSMQKSYDGGKTINNLTNADGNSSFNRSLVVNSTTGEIGSENKILRRIPFFGYTNRSGSTITDTLGDVVELYAYSPEHIYFVDHTNVNLVYYLTVEAGPIPTSGAPFIKAPAGKSIRIVPKPGTSSSFITGATTFQLKRGATYLVCYENTVVLRVIEI